MLVDLAQREGCSIAALDVVFCDDEYLLTINQQHLKHDTYTDIITFDLRDRKLLAAEGKKLPIVGEIYISVDRVSDNALCFGATRLKELHRVLFHGCLHLCGYGDKKAGDKAMMTSKENEYLALFNIDVPRGT